MVAKYTPFINIGPGEFIKEELEFRNWIQEDLARILGISLKSVSKLIMNKQPITMEMARLLHKAFGQSPQYWLNLDTNYRLRLQESTEAEKDVAVRAKIYEYMPIKEMVKKGWLKACETVEELVLEVKEFWEIRKLILTFLDEHALPNMRKSAAFTQYNRYYALTWCQMARRCACQYNVPVYKKVALEQLAKKLHHYTVEENGVALFLEKLNQAGVKFFVLSHLSKTYIDGAAFYDDGHPVIVYTKRYDRIDNFWFTIAHEIAHVLRHFKKKDDFFIDDVKERQADEFASKILKENEINTYMNPFGKYIARNKVEKCAQDLKVHEGIVVGVLQHYGNLPRRNLNNLKIKVSELKLEKYHAENQLVRM